MHRDFASMARRSGSRPTSRSPSTWLCMSLRPMRSSMGRSPASAAALRYDGNCTPIDHVLLTWRESDGPPVSTPSSRGFGTRLLERAFAATDGEVRLHFLADGLFCEMRFAGAIPNQQAVA